MVKVLETMPIDSFATVESFMAFELAEAEFFAAELSCALNAPAKVVKLADPLVAEWVYVYVAPKYRALAKMFAKGYRARANARPGATS